MDASPPSNANNTRVFLSYARKDGAVLAVRLHDQLQAREHEVWQDVFDMHGGDDWWLQIEDRIGQAGAVVLVVTPAALASDIVRREWVHARRTGVPIFPVTEDGAILDKAPRWMRQVDVIVLGAPGADSQPLERFYSQIAGPPRRRPVPFRVPSLPLSFTPREREREQILRHVLDESKQNPIARTVVVHGPPGFGKTTLVEDVCHLPEIVDAFTGGVLWAHIGNGGGGLLPGLNDMVSALLDRDVRFESADQAASRLRELLEHRDCLLVLDDVWDEADIKPILRSTNCARFITTRDVNYCMPDGAVAEPVGEMLTSEAGNLLSQLIAPEEGALPEVDARQHLALLARRLGEWPLLLRLTGGAIQRELRNGAPLPQALTTIERALDAGGLTAFDRTRSKDRDYAVSVSVGASVTLYPEDQRQRLYELAALAADSAFPERVAERLWAATSGMPASTARSLVRDFSGTFLQLAFDRRTGVNRIRFHDAIREYLLTQLPSGRVRELHGALLDSYRPAAASWDAVEDDGYIFDRVAFHLARAGRTAELYALMDESWMTRQLRRTHSPRAFLEDMRAASDAARAEVPVNLVQLARGSLIEATLRSSAGVLSPAMLSALARLGRGDTAHDYAAVLPDAGERAESYRLVAEIRLGQGADAAGLQARELLEQAETAVEHVVDVPRRARLLGTLSFTVARAGESLWARRLAGQTLSLAQTLAGGEDKTVALADAARALLRAGDRASARPLIDEVVNGAQQPLYAIAYVGAAPVMAKNARTLAAAAAVLQEAGDADRAREIAADGRAAALNVMARTDPLGAVSAMAQIAGTYRTLGDQARSDEVVQEAATLAARVLGDDAALALSAVARAFVAPQTNDRAIRLAREALDLAGDMAPGPTRLNVVGQTAGVLIDAGDRAGAARAANEAMTGAWAAGSIAAKAAAMRQVADASAAAGDIQGARMAADLALAAADGIPDRQTRIDAWSSIGEVLARDGVMATADAGGSSNEARAWILYGVTRARVAQRAENHGDVDITGIAAAVDQVPDPLTRVLISLNLAKAFTDAGVHETAKLCLARAETNSAAIIEPDQYAYAVDQLVSSLIDAGDAPGAARLAAVLRARAESTADHRVREPMLAQTVHALATAGRFDDANAVARNIQGLDEMLRALIGLARGLSKRGRFDEVEALINETPLGFPENWPESAQAESDLAAALAEQGQAVRAVEQAKRIHPQYVASTLRTVALALAARHDFAAALEAAQAIAVEQGRDSVETEVLSRMADAGNGVEAAARAEGLASAGWKSIALARIAKPIADAGRRTDAAGLVKKARALAGDIAETPLKVVAFCELAETLSAMQDADAVRTTLADAFLAASAAGRDGVFQALFRGAGSMASLDKAVTLRAVTDEIVRVEQWWATPLPLSVTQ